MQQKKYLFVVIYSQNGLIVNKLGVTKKMNGE